MRKSLLTDFKRGDTVILSSTGKKYFVGHSYYLTIAFDHKWGRKKMIGLNYYLEKTELGRFVKYPSKRPNAKAKGCRLLLIEKTKRNELT